VNGKKLATFGVCIILLIAAISYFSPYWTVHCLRDAFKKKDVAALNTLVDYPILRENVKNDCATAIGRRLRDSSPEGHGLLSTLGLMVGNAVIDVGVDALVSPASLEALFDGASPREVIQNEGAPNAAPQTQFTKGSVKPTYDYAYESLDSFVVHRKTDTSALTFGLERTGPFSWKLNRIQID
jgi:hypothetical protein